MRRDELGDAGHLQLVAAVLEVQVDQFRCAFTQGPLQPDLVDPALCDRHRGGGEAEPKRQIRSGVVTAGRCIDGDNGSAGLTAQAGHGDHHGRHPGYGPYVDVGGPAQPGQAANGQSRLQLGRRLAAPELPEVRVQRVIEEVAVVVVTAEGHARQR